MEAPSDPGPQSWKGRFFGGAWTTILRLGSPWSEGVAEMTMKRVETVTEVTPLPPLDVASLPPDLPAALKFSPLRDDELAAVAALRGTSEPWAKRGETAEE